MSNVEAELVAALHQVALKFPSLQFERPRLDGARWIIAFAGTADGAQLGGHLALENDEVEVEIETGDASEQFAEAIADAMLEQLSDEESDEIEDDSGGDDFEGESHESAPAEEPAPAMADAPEAQAEEEEQEEEYDEEDEAVFDGWAGLQAWAREHYELDDDEEDFFSFVVTWNDTERTQKMLVRHTESADESWVVFASYVARKEQVDPWALLAKNMEETVATYAVDDEGFVQLVYSYPLDELTPRRFRPLTTYFAARADDFEEELTKADEF